MGMVREDIGELALYAMGMGLDLIAPSVENHKRVIIREVTPSVSV